MSIGWATQCASINAGCVKSGPIRLDSIFLYEKYQSFKEHTINTRSMQSCFPYSEWLQLTK